MPSRSPTVRRRRLGQELRTLREEKNLTVEHVGKELEWSPSKVSRIETATVKVSGTDLRALLDLYAVEPELRTGLIELGKESRETSYWMRFKDNTPIKTFKDYIGFENEAVSIKTYEPTIIPGLLQTEEYARAVIGVMGDVVSSQEQGDLDERVGLRLARQQVLQRQVDRPQYTAVVDEAALRRPIGGRRLRNVVMRDQVQKLITMVTAKQIRLLVLPFEAGAHPGLNGAFTILELPHPADPNVVYVEAITNAFLLEDPDEVAFYDRVFDLVQGEALGTDASIEFLQEIQAEYAAKIS
jgi:transcriptional regulator with XRE-family HTH domain